MTVKSVIDIELNDSDFTRFNSIFKKYQGEVKSHPGEWKNIGKAVGKVASSFEEMIAALSAQAERAGKLEKAENKIEQSVSRQARTWRSLATSTRDAAAHIGKATDALLKWAGLTSVFAGLVGFGGLFGIDRLAINASSGRRSSMGLGTTYGEEKSFDTNFSRFVDPRGFLSGVNEALHDVTKRFALYAAGLTQGDIQGKSTAEVSVKLLEKLGPLLTRTPDAQMAQLLQARGLDQFISLEDAMRLKHATPEERATQIAHYRRDVSSFGLGDDALRKWQDFSTQLDRAGQNIESVFVRGLTPLTPALMQLSDAFSSVLESFLKAAGDNHWIDDLAGSLKHFATYMGSPEFKDNVVTFAKNIATLGSSIAGLIKKLEPVFKFLGLAAPVVAGAAIGARVGGMFGLPGAGIGAVIGAGAGVLYDLTPPDTGAAPPMPVGSGMSTLRTRPAPRKTAFEVNVLDMIRNLEASGDGQSSPKGAIGRYQIMPATARGYGFDPSRLTDPAYNATAAQTIVADFAKKAKSLDEILILYNSTPAYLKKFRESGGDVSVLMPETRRYLERAHRMIDKQVNASGVTFDDESMRQLAAAFRTSASTGKSVQIAISVQSEPGANAIVSASQVAQ